MPRIERFGLTENVEPNIMHKAFFSPKYWYYDTPDGKDCAKKLWWTVKYFGFLGLHLGLLDSCMRNPLPKDAFTVISRFSVCIYRTVLVASGYSAVTCCMCSIRNKNDYWNQLAGSATSAAILSKYCKNSYIAFEFGLVIAILACAKKFANDLGQNLLINVVPQRLLTSHYSIMHDYTMLIDDKPSYLKTYDMKPYVEK